VLVKDTECIRVVCCEITYRYRIEYHSTKEELLHNWIQHTSFPWSQYARGRTYHSRSRVTDLLLEEYSLPPYLVSIEELYKLLEKPCSVPHYSKGMLMYSGVTQNSLDQFMSCHKRIFIDRALGFMHRCDKEFICPFQSELCSIKIQKKYRVKGGIICGTRNSHKTQGVINMLMQVQTPATTLILMNRSNYVTAYHISKLYENQIQMVWCPEDISFSKLYYPRVILNVDLWDSVKKDIMSRQWYNVVYDECDVVDVIPSVSCVWIIEAELDFVTQGSKWWRLFKLHNLFGGTFQMNEQVYDILCFYMGYSRVAFPHYQQITASHHYIRFNEEYPWRLIKSVLHRLLHQDPKNYDALYDFFVLLLCIESDQTIDKVNLLSHLYTLNNNRRNLGYYWALPEFSDLTITCQHPTYIPSEICAVCQDESNNQYMVRNIGCSHFLCYSCMYMVNVIHGSCPLCRTVYGDHFYKSAHSMITEWFRSDSKDDEEEIKVSPVITNLWTSIMDNGNEELLNLLSRCENKKTVIVSCYGGVEAFEIVYFYLYRHYPTIDIYEVIGSNTPSLHHVIYERVYSADIILIDCLETLYWFRHDNRIQAIIALNIDPNYSILQLMSHYFRGAMDNKFVITAPYSLTHTLINELNENDSPIDPIHTLGKLLLSWNH
jgi:hypothetical protein